MSDNVTVRTQFYVAILLVALGLLASAAETNAAGEAASPEEIRWEPYSYETRDGALIDDGEIGRLVVPERHGHRGGQTIELAFVRFKSTSPNPGPPIVWLAGGPSDFGTDDIEGPYLALVREFQKVADVIALDQRGTGLTRPLLVCPPNESLLPLDRPFDVELARAEYGRLSRECAAHFQAEGIDLSAYNTMENAHDVDLLRSALGVPRVSLYGGSYGTHLALAVLRYHPESVDRIVLSGVEGPDHTWKLPSKINRFFETVFAAARKDSAVAANYPDVELMVRSVLERVEAEPVVVELTPEDGGAPPETIVLGVYELKLLMRAFLGSRDSIGQLPAILQVVYDGDYGMVAEYLRSFRQISIGSAMYYCMDCASGVSPARQKQIDDELATSVSGEINFPFPAICNDWPNDELGDGFRAELRSDRPALFVSGTFDGQTPPSNAAEVAAGFSNPTQILVEGGSHQYLELEPPALGKRMAQFFAGTALSDTVFVRPLEFALPE